MAKQDMEFGIDNPVVPTASKVGDTVHIGNTYDDFDMEEAFGSPPDEHYPDMDDMFETGEEPIVPESKPIPKPIEEVPKADPVAEAPIEPKPTIEPVPNNVIKPTKSTLEHTVAQDPSVELNKPFISDNGHEFIQGLEDSDVDKIVKNNYKGYEKEFGDISKLSVEEQANKMNDMRSVAADILGVGDGKSGSYSLGHDFKARSIDSTADLENMVKAHQGNTSDADLINKMFDIEDTHSPFSNSKEAIEMFKEDPEEFGKVLKDRVEHAKKGNIGHETTMDNLGKAMGDSMDISDDIKKQVDLNENKSTYEAVINRKNKKAKDLARAAKDRSLNPGVVEEAINKGVQLEGDIAPLVKNKNIGKKIQNFLHGGGGTMAAIVGSSIAIGTIASSVSSSQQERQRKEAELNRLSMANGHGY